MRINRILSSAIAVALLGVSALAVSAVSAFAYESNTSTAKLEISAESRLAEHRILTHHNLKIAVNRNRIVLSGKVSTLYQKKEAGYLVKQAANGLAVVNDLKLSAPQVRDSVIDAEVMERIQTAQPYTVFDWASARSRKGIVTLTGWVDQPWYVGEYRRQAERVIGVRQVINHIKFTLGYRRLAKRAVSLIYDENMFPGSSLLLDPPVHVIADNGRVILEGAVGSSGLAAYLANLIRYHTDAIRVTDNLRIRG